MNITVLFSQAKSEPQFPSRGPLPTPVLKCLLNCCGFNARMGLKGLCLKRGSLKELFVDVYPWRGSKQRWVIMRCFNPFWAWVDSEKQSWAFAALESLLGIWSWLMCVHLSTGLCTDARRWSAAPRHRILAGCTETRGCCTCHESKILLHIFKNQAILTCPYILSCFLFVVPQCLSVKCVCVWGGGGGGHYKV